MAAFAAASPVWAKLNTSKTAVDSDIMKESWRFSNTVHVGAARSFDLAQFFQRFIGIHPVAVLLADVSKPHGAFFINDEG